MSTQLGGFYDLPHGVCNAILLPHVEAYNALVVPERFVDIAEALGEDVTGLNAQQAADRAIAAIRKLSADVGIPRNLRELGVKAEDLRTLAQNALKDACGATNPKQPSLDEVIDIYERAMAA